MPHAPIKFDNLPDSAKFVMQKYISDADLDRLCGMLSEAVAEEFRKDGNVLPRLILFMPREGDGLPFPATMLPVFPGDGWHDDLRQIGRLFRVPCAVALISETWHVARSSMNDLPRPPSQCADRIEGITVAIQSVDSRMRARFFQIIREVSPPEIVPLGEGIFGHGSSAAIEAFYQGVMEALLERSSGGNHAAV